MGKGGSALIRPTGTSDHFISLLCFLRYTPVVATPGHLSSASYLASSNLASAGGAKFIANAGLAGAVYPATAAYAHNGYVSGSDHYYPGAAATGYYGVGGKVIAGNGIYAANGLHAHGGLLASTSGLRSVGN